MIHRCATSHRRRHRLPLMCSHCRKLMDSQGDHATQCGSGFGTTHRHNVLPKCVARFVFKAAGLGHHLQAPCDTQTHSTDILVLPGAPRPGRPLSLLQLRCYYPEPFPLSALGYSLRRRRRLMVPPRWETRRNLHRSIIPSAAFFDSPRTATVSELPWSSSPLSFDTLSAPSARARSLLDHYARLNPLRHAYRARRAEYPRVNRPPGVLW